MAFFTVHSPHSLGLSVPSAYGSQVECQRCLMPVSTPLCLTEAKDGAG